MNKEIRIKPGWTMKCKVKKFTTIEAVGSYKVDSYDNDIYIPQAQNQADAEMVKAGEVTPETGKANRLGQPWSNAFMGAMNTILSDQGLRVL